MDAEARLFKALSDPTRLRLAALLAVEGEVCVCRLAEALEIAEYNVSRHLGVLRNAGMVGARREGTWIYYRLSGARNGLEDALQKCLREFLAEHAAVAADRERLAGAVCGG